MDKFETKYLEGTDVERHTSFRNRMYNAIYEVIRNCGYDENYILEVFDCYTIGLSQDTDSEDFIEYLDDKERFCVSKSLIPVHFTYDEAVEICKNEKFTTLEGETIVPKIILAQDYYKKKAISEENCYNFFMENFR